MTLLRSLKLSKYYKIPILNFVSGRNFHNQSNDKSKSTTIGYFENKLAVITGGASGIGAAIAYELFKQGLESLVILDKDKNEGQKFVDKLCDERGDESILFTEADVTNVKEMEKAFYNTVMHFGPIDIIINNAGIMKEKQWEKQIKTNLHGCILGTLLGMQYMPKSSSKAKGTIVNIGSSMSIVPVSDFPIYTMTHCGIAGFSKALGSSNLYERTGVRIFAFCPGLTNTTLIKNASKNTINDNFGLEYQEEIENCVVQSTDSVVQGLINIFEVATPGSLWIAENNREPYEVNNFDAAAIKKFIDRGVKENSKKQ